MSIFLPRGKTLGAKSAKKYCHVGTLEAFHLWSLGTSVKAKRSTSYSLPIKLLDFLHLLTNKHNLKIPLGILSSDFAIYYKVNRVGSTMDIILVIYLAY